MLAAHLQGHSSCRHPAHLFPVAVPEGLSLILPHVPAGWSARPECRDGLARPTAGKRACFT